MLEDESDFEVLKLRVKKGGKRRSIYLNFQFYDDTG